MHKMIIIVTFGISNGEGDSPVLNLGTRAGWQSSAPLALLCYCFIGLHSVLVHYIAIRE